MAQVRQSSKSRNVLCPKCGNNLAEVKLKNVRVNRCTGCGGVWLDKGELEKLTQHGEGSLSNLIRSFFYLD